MYSTRCFVAVPVGPPAISVLGRLLARLSAEVPGVKWTRPEQLHISVKFLGELDNRDLLTVCEELAKICAPLEPTSASLSGLGTFPKNKPPKVVWVGLDLGRELLEQLYQQLDQAFIAMGIPQEGRAYTPHLTLGRVARDTDLQLLERTMQSIEPEVQTLFDIEEVVIYASLREKSGVVYEPIETIVL